MPPSTNQPILTLTTDFGLRDHYVGTMKGVILSRCPEARLVDISHEVPAFSLYAGAYTIDQAARYFPPGTVHLVVVDPGVGTERRAVVVETAQQFFVAPDNGVLSLVCARSGAGNAWELTNQSLFLPATSSTFHGRDIFAPVAAALVCGVAAHDLGPAVRDLVCLPALDPLPEAGTWAGLVFSVDSFGNIITNFTRERFGGLADKPFELTVNGYRLKTFHRTFGDAPPDKVFAYYGSSGYVEVGVREGSAAALTGARPGSRINLGQ